MLLKNIFLIDDEKVFNIIHTRLIRQAGYENKLTVFTDAREALSKIKQMIATDYEELPDLIFLDIQMPGMSGWDFLNEFETIMASVPKLCEVCILSYTIGEAEVIRGQTYSTIRELIHKPLTAEHLQRLFKQ